MSDEKVIALPTGYDPNESVPRSEIEKINGQLEWLSEEVLILSKLVGQLLRELRRKQPTR